MRYWQKVGMEETQQGQAQRGPVSLGLLEAAHPTGRLLVVVVVAVMETLRGGLAARLLSVGYIFPAQQIMPSLGLRATKG
ncbi:MAG: hypothetical protein NT159_01445 [Proteobacteria bacterium]|nr:hypothetical protein [Pseudomonadota bacterium]